MLKFCKKQFLSLIIIEITQNKYNKIVIILIYYQDILKGVTYAVTWVEFESWYFPKHLSSWFVWKENTPTVARCHLPNRKTNLVGQDNYARSQKHIILTCTSSLCFLLLSYWNGNKNRTKKICHSASSLMVTFTQGSVEIGQRVLLLRAFCSYYDTIGHIINKEEWW